jgi:hypothetical protein
MRLLEAKMNSTTRTMHARKTTARKVSETVTERLVARIDEDAPAKVAAPRRRSGPVDEGAALRLPDFHEDGMAVFIGEDATVLVDERTLAEGDLDLLLTTGSVKARRGQMPNDEGIVVFPHSDALEMPCYSGKNAEAYAAWRHAHDTLLVSA